MPNRTNFWRLLLEAPIMPDPQDPSNRSLGEQKVDRDGFELDTMVADNYLKYSGELLRLALLAITGWSILWLKIVLPGGERTEASPLTLLAMGTTFVLLATSAAAAVFQRYTSAHALTHHLDILRCRARQRPAVAGRESDRERAKRLEKRRNRLFKWSGHLLAIAAWGLILGIVGFGIAVGLLAHPTGHVTEPEHHGAAFALTYRNGAEYSVRRSI
jgi:hypothetical protein